MILLNYVASQSFTVENLIQNIMLNDYNRTDKIPEKDDKFRIMVFGDFGRFENYFRIGETAEVMSQLAQQKHYEYFITTGDNFYPKGIPYMWFRLIPWVAMTNFKRSPIRNTLIYPTLGNHDCYGSTENTINYSNYDSQWTLGEEFYVMKQPMNDDPSKYFVNLMLNSCKLFCPTDEFSDLNEECRDMHIEPGSEDVSVHYQWLEEQLKLYSTNPNVAWLAISMHHPAFLEQGEKKYLLPLLRKYKVDIMFVGHDHWSEYANMDPEYEIRFPNSRRGPVIDDCHGTTEIINTETREVTFPKGVYLHQFLAGSGGADLDDICPYEDQDGKVYWRSIEGYGVLAVEMNSTHFSGRFVIGGQKELYKVNIVNENSAHASK